MARRAPAVTRAIQFVDLLVSHPNDRFTLSELVRRTGTSLGSAHAVLSELETAGYVCRHPTTKTYALGPALVVAGGAALAHQPAIGAAMGEIAVLARELGVETVVTAATSDEIVFVARSGLESPRAPALPEGVRVPLVPPIGAVFMAWAPDHVVEAWLDRAPHGDSGAADRNRATLTLVRRRGYAISSASETQRLFGATVFSLTDSPWRDELRADLDELLAALATDEYAVGSFDPARRYDIGMIAAPVFDGDGHVAAAICATGFEPGLSAPDVARRARRIRDAAAVVTKRSRGRPSRR
jgi:DNA-binding IclR family transcriptional regulator